MTLPSPSLLLLVALAAPAAAWGAPQDEPLPEATSPAALCGPGATDDTFCIPELGFRRWITDGDLQILDFERTAQGVSGAKKVRMRVADGDGTIVFDVKWKAIPRGRDVFNNSPRRELAAQAIADLVLPAGRSVVVPTELMCVRQVDGLGGRLHGLDCSLGLVSLWLHNVGQAPYFDAAKWDSDPRFRAAMADFNVLTYLIDHRDSRDANFLKSTDPANPRFISIDNGLAFSGFRNTLGFFKFVRFPSEADYRKIQVPAIAQVHVDALRSLTREDLDTLAVVRQFEIQNGDFVPVPPTEPLAPRCGHARKDGVVQLGLTTHEIDTLERRIADLLGRIDDGSLATF